MSNNLLCDEYEEEGFLVELFHDEETDRTWADLRYAQDDRYAFSVETHDREQIALCAKIFWEAYRQGDQHGLTSTVHALQGMLDALVDTLEGNQNNENEKTDST